MGERSDLRRVGSDSVSYTESQVESVIRGCGVEVEGETLQDFLCFCPFHGNRHTPSFSVSKTNGKFICFNGACNESGTLIELIQRTTSRTYYEAVRTTLQYKTQELSFEEKLKNIIEEKPIFMDFGADKVDALAAAFWKNDKAVDYMMNKRSFTEDTLRKYQIGYSAKKNLITVPMHTAEGMPIGVIGRSPSSTDKIFKNSSKLPTSKTLFNVHRAKRAGETVVVCEASFDTMRIDQCGYPNVVSTLSGNFSPFHFEQLSRYFSRVIIMTDFDKKELHTYRDCRKCAKRGFTVCHGHNPGRELGAKIAGMMQTARKEVLWAMYDNKTVFPHGAKDPGEMLDDEIVTCLTNPLSHYEYELLGLS